MYVSLFDSNGYNFAEGNNYIGVNQSSQSYVSWTFRKAPKFFDVVTYTGDGTANRQIAHSLGVVPGMIVIKRTDAVTDWAVWHKNLATDNILVLNGTYASIAGQPEYFGTQSSSTFGVDNGSFVNALNGTYVAYLFAHDPAPDGKIQCGSFTKSGGIDVSVTLGWEPQYLLFKTADVAGNWDILDTSRNWSHGNDGDLLANNSAAEGVVNNYGNPTATGFITGGAVGNGTFIYCAIRRPNKPPVSSAGVFAMDYGDVSDLGIKTNIITDFGILAQTSGTDKFYFGSRLTGQKYLSSTSASAELSHSNQTWDRMNGFWNNNLTSYFGVAFRRAPGFFDIVAYTGTGVAMTVPHNLGVVPELIIIKQRNGTYGWKVIYTSNIANSLVLEATSSWSGVSLLNTTQPTNSVITIGAIASVNNTGDTYISYLFATLPGISKVGSYTGTGAQQDIDAGFATGPAFLLIKRTDATGDWYLWDSTRGIVSAGNDPYLLLNSTAVEVTTTNYIDPINTGFRLTSTAPAALNASGGTYIYYSVAKP